MHVIFLPTWYPACPSDLLGSFFREQAIALHRAGCKVGVLAPRLLSPLRPLSAYRESREMTREVDEGVPTFRKGSINWTPRLWLGIAWSVQHIGMQLYRAYVAEHGRPSVVHVHASLIAGVVALEISRVDGVPFVVSEHGSTYARGAVPAAGLRLARKITERAAARFAVSAPFCRLLEQLLGHPSPSWSPVPNMVDRAFLDMPLPERAGPGLRLLHVSLLDKNKNVDLILRAFQCAFPRDRDVSLTIGGDGLEGQALRQLASELGLTDRVSFLGRLSREQVRAAMAESDAFVLSSRYETFGVVIIEAMAMGLPVVATRCGGPDDIVTPEIGLLVPPGDQAAMVDALRAIQAKRKQWPAQRIRSHCLARYGPDVITARWMDVYQQVCVHGTVAI